MALTRARRWLLLEPGEALPVALSFGYFLSLLCAYFMLRPIRESMAVASGSATVPLLFTGTFVVMALVVPLFGYLVARFPRRRFLPATYVFFILNLLVFYLLFRSQLNGVWVGRTYFVWLSVFNMFVVSVFWSFMTDLYSDRQARRLFGLIAAGGSIGAICGPLLTAALAPVLGTANLMLAAAGFLVVALLCQVRLLAFQADATTTQPPIGGSIWAGATLLLRSKFLLRMAGVLALFTFLQTVIYNQQIILVEQAYNGADPTRFFALVDLGANVTALTLELLVTSRLLRALGVARTLVIMPLFTLVGLVLLSIWPQILLLGLFQALRRGGEYGLMKPARELLYTQVDQETRYKAKNFIDTFVYRGGDVSSGWAYMGLSQGLGFSLPVIAALAAPVAALWAWLSWQLGRHFSEPGKTDSGSSTQQDDRPTTNSGGGP